MKHHVLMAFKDKESGEYFLPGSFFISKNEQRVKQLSNLHVIKPNVDFPFNETAAIAQITVPDLRAVAKQLKIKGYTKMSDEELEQAIAEHGGDVNDNISESEERVTD